MQLPKKHKIIISSFSILLMLILIVPSEKATASRQNDQTDYQIGKRYQLSLSTEDSISTKSATASTVKNSQIKKQKITTIEPTNKAWQTAKVRSGDSLAKILKRFGFNASTTYNVINAEGEHTQLLKKLNVGDHIRIASNNKHQLIGLEYPLSKTQTLHVNLTREGYRSYKETKTVEIRETFAFGIIKSNFWSAAIEAGLEDKQIIELANVFGWDIDFALDIRKGDSFHVIYENRYIDSEYIGPGKILAAEFVNQDDEFQAIRFSDDMFYTPDGRSMRKAFLRAPVNFRYISSNFKPKRFHPIQKRWKAHRGTDYRAKKGTPVVAAGDGKVTHSTYNRYNGHYVFLQHGNGIVTKYLHFSKRAVKKGQRVKQGQVIGYVGSTGMSQASHLHYEFLLNGVHRNPRTVKLPDAKPINNKFKVEFSLISAQRLKDLLGSKQASLAMQSSSINQQIVATQTADD